MEVGRVQLGEPSACPRRGDDLARVAAPRRPVPHRHCALSRL